jgi:hypothetical protein
VLARKKAGVIEVVQYRAGEPLPFQGLVVGSVTGEARIYNAPQDSWVTVNDGDYIRIDNPDDIYPINADYFAANYDVVEEPAMTLDAALDTFNRVLGSWDIEPHTDGEEELRELRAQLRKSEQDHDALYPGLESPRTEDCWYCNELRSRIATLLEGQEK